MYRFIGLGSLPFLHKAYHLCKSFVTISKACPVFIGKLIYLVPLVTQDTQRTHNKGYSTSASVFKINIRLAIAYPARPLPLLVWFSSLISVGGNYEFRRFAVLRVSFILSAAFATLVFQNWLRHSCHSQNVRT